MPQTIRYDITLKVLAPAGAAVTFVGRDPWTRGSWIGRYGPDGHMIAGLPAALPAYVTANLPPPALPWIGQEHATSGSALSRPGAPEDRILSQWTPAFVDSPKDPGPFKLELTLAGRHRVALYFLSMHGPEPANRYMSVQAVNPATGEVYDTRHLGDDDLEFIHGVWLVYEAEGRVDFVFTRTGVQQRPTLGAALFGGTGVPAPPPPAGPLSAALTAPATAEPGLPFNISWTTANAAIVTLDGLGVPFSSSRTEELHASRTYALEAIYPGVPNASATAAVTVAPPPPTGDGYNVLLRGQSNAQYFAEYGGLVRLRGLMEARLGKRVNLAYAARHPQGRNTAVSATGFVREFFTAGQPTAHEAGVLGRLVEMPEADRSRPTLTVWMHNEYDGATVTPPITQAEAEAAYRADMALVRPLLGLGRSPYAYVWVPFTPGPSSAAVRAAQDALVADPAALAFRAPDILPAEMDGPSHIARHGALSLADRLAGPLSDILLALDPTPPPPAAPTGSLTVAPAAVAPGGTATLTWASTGAATATLDGTAVATSGSRTVTPAATTAYTLLLTGPGGTATYAATLTVTATPPPPPPDGLIGTATITVDKGDHVVTKGEAVTVVAEVTGAAEVWVQTLEGRTNLGPIGGTFTFTPKVSGPLPLLAVDAAGGVTVKPMSVIVKVDSPALDPTAPPTLTTVQDGPLDDPATWGGRLPGPDETVEVKHGCNYTGRKFWCGRLINTGAITVKDGVLHTTDYDDRGVGSLTLDGRGVSKALVMLHNRPRHPNDVDDFWRCAWVRGAMTVRGQPATRRVELAGSALAGQSSLALASPVGGWQAGHKVVLPDTRRIRQGQDDHREEEVVVVRGVSADGQTVHLLSPLRYDHTAVLDPDGTVVFRPKALHLIANAGFLTSDPTTVESRCHVRVEGKARLDVDHGLFHGTGRSGAGDLAASTTQERNPLRLHQLLGPEGGVGDALTWPDGSVGAAQFRVCNSVMIDPPPVVTLGKSRVGWGLTLDDSHWGLVEGNTSFNWRDAHFVCLRGTESGNLLRGNSAVALAWVGHSEAMYGFGNVAHTATGFWCRGADNWLVDNFASGLYRGYVISPYMAPEQEVRVPARRGADPAVEWVTLMPRNHPLRGFDGNEAGGYIVNYLEMWQVGSAGGPTATDASVSYRESVVRNVKAWRFSDHVYYNYTTGGVTIDGVVAREGNIAFFSSDYMAHGFKLKNVDARNLHTGWHVSPLYDQSCENCHFEAFYGVNVGLIWAAGWGAQNLPPRHVTIKGLTWAPPRYDYPAWWGPACAIKMSGLPHWGLNASNYCNYLQKNTVAVEDFGRTTGDSFRLYFKEQAADAIVPYYGSDVRYIAAPEPGLTNAQCWAKYGTAFAGAVAPPGCVERETIGGLVGPL